MLKYLKIRLKPFLKLIKFDVLYFFLVNRIFINRTAVTVEKDLSTLRPLKDPLAGSGLKLLEITPPLLGQDGKKGETLIYPARSGSENRYLKAVHYLNKGYRGFALVRGREVCGDIWYVAGSADQRGPVHPDLAWLGIRCRKNEAYAFDMHLYPDQRGKNMAVGLQIGALQEMRKKGFTRVFGYYWACNIPALWVHRTLQWKELGTIKVSRFFLIRHYSYKPISRTKGPSVPGIAPR